MTDNSYKLDLNYTSLLDNRKKQEDGGIQYTSEVGDIIDSQYYSSDINC